MIHAFVPHLSACAVHAAIEANSDGGAPAE